jgi:hypothetical protein
VTRDRWWAVALLVVGSFQMTGDLLDVPWLVGLGAASHASPAPKVFTTVGDGEPFSADFEIAVELSSGERTVVPLTSERYRQIEGPYNRRNAFGAVVAGGPHLHDAPHVGPMMEAAGRYAVCGDAPLLRELGLLAEPSDGGAVPVSTTLLQRGRDGRIVRWELRC